jgi:hypothetical protein
MAALRLRKLWMVAFLPVVLVVFMGAYGGSEKARVDATNIRYLNPTLGEVVSISETYPCTVTSADINLEPFELNNSAAFAMFVKITNSTGAAASLKLQAYDPVNGTWADRISATTGAASVMTVLTFTAAVDGWLAITDLPVNQRFRFVAVKDATSDKYAITKLIVVHQ